MYKPRKPTQMEEDAGNRHPGSSVQQGQPPARQSVPSGQRSTSGRPSQMQVALPQNHPQYPAIARTTSTIRPRPTQLPPGNAYNQPVRSVYSDNPSRMQVVVVQEQPMVTRRSEQVLNAMMQPPAEYTPGPHLISVMPSMRELSPSRDPMPAQQRRIAPPTQLLLSSGQAPRTQIQPSSRQAPRTQVPPTFVADRPQTGRTNIIVAGEPHHFGMRADYQHGGIISTLCRCANPNNHGDAYTMLNSPRGRDIHGQPIDWQEAKKRMLDHHAKNQISHAEEIAAVPFVYDAQTVQVVMQGEEELKKGIRGGQVISVNTEQNRVDWHNGEGHAKKWVTIEGAQTRFGG